MKAKGIGSLLVLGTILALATFYFSGDASSAGGTTERASVDSSGNEGDDHSGWGGEGRPGISGDGRFVAFTSEATNLALNDGNEAADVFVHDRETGTTERVSVDSSGNEGNDHSYGQAISGDCRFVAFSSWATNLVTDDTNTSCDYDYDGNYDENCRDVFVHDRETGITGRVSVDSSGNDGDGESWEPAISADGRFVAFSSAATNLVPGDINGLSDVFVYDRVTRVTERVGVWGEAPDITGDGRFVAFLSHATLVPEDTNGVRDVYVHDRLTGAHEIVSVSSTGDPANAQSWYPSITGDGRFVAFSGGATNLVPHDPNGSDADVFVHDRLSGVTERISWQSPEDEEDTAAAQPSMTGVGHVVAFIGVCRYECGGGQIVVRDLQTGATEVASVASNGDWGNNASFHPSISSNGRFVAFSSQAFNLVPDDYNDAVDVFVYERCIEGPCGGEPSPTPTPGPQTEIDYFALGDSIASGRGLMDRGDKCRTSNHAYPYLVAGHLESRFDQVNFGPLRHFACTGAKSTRLKQQVDDVIKNLGSNPTLVSITIGANDFDFGNYHNWVRRFGRNDWDSYQGWVDRTSRDVKTRVKKQVDRLLQHPNVAVVVTGVHNPFNTKSVIFGIVNLRMGRDVCQALANDCYTRTEYGINTLNAELAKIPRELENTARVRFAGVNDLFQGHESPKTGSAWQTCGFADPGISDTYIQYPGDPTSNSNPFEIRFPGFTLKWEGGDCFHPNVWGAMEYAESVNEQAERISR